MIYKFEIGLGVRENEFIVKITHRKKLQQLIWTTESAEGEENEADVLR